MQRAPTVAGTTNLIDILDRVLDKGLVVAGDIRVSLANVELLTVRIRLLICSVDKAEQIGLNWWKYDPNLSLPQTPPSPPLGLPPGAVRRQQMVRGPATVSRTSGRRAPAARKTGKTKGKR